MIKITRLIEHFRFTLSLGILEIGKNISAYRNSFPYWADVKPLILKTGLILSSACKKCMHLSMLSVCVHYDLYCARILIEWDISQVLGK